MTQKMRPFEYKESYNIEVEKIDKGVYNFKTKLNDKIILQEKNLKKPNMFKVGDYIRTKIDEYEVENGIITPEKPEPEEEEFDEEEEEEEEDKIDEVLEEELEERPDDEEQAKKQFEKETGLNAMTTKGKLRKDYLKWKKTNWD